MSDLRRSHEDFLCDELLIGYFGDDEDDPNEAFLQVSAEFESKLRLVQQAPSLALAQPSTTSSTCRNQTHFLLLVPVSAPSSTRTFALPKNTTMVLQELEPRYQPIKLQYFK